MEAKVTFIVPVYNVENYIDRCLISLTEQTLEDIEIILIDDGSTDQSGSICDEYGQKDERIRVIHKANAGQGLARNDGLDKATGKYICFLDSDDYMETDTAEELYGIMEDLGADMASFGYEIDSPSGEVVRIPLIRDDCYMTPEDIRRRFVPHFFGDDPEDDNLRGFSSCMSCFRRSVIEEHHLRFPSERVVLTEDTAFCLEFCKVAKKIVTTSEVYYYYCQKADSFSQGYRADRMDKTIKMQKMLITYSRELGISEIPNIRLRLAMYVWVNLMSSLKQEVRRMDEGVPRKIVRENILKMCKDVNIRSAIGGLSKAKLPLKQKILFGNIWLKAVDVVMLLCSVRARQGI